MKNTGSFELKLKSRFSLKKKHVKGSLDAWVIKPSGELLLVSYDRHQLLSCQNDGQDLRDVAVFDNEPIDVALLLEHNSVVIGFWGETEVMRVDLKSGIIKGMGFEALGVDYKEGYILASIP